MSLLDEPCCLCLETSPALLDDPCHHISRHFIVIVGRAMLLYTKIPSCYYLKNHAVIYLETSPALHKIPYHNVIRGSCKKFCHCVRITSVLRFIKHIFITNLQSILHFTIIGEHWFHRQRIFTAIAWKAMSLCCKYFHRYCLKSISIKIHRHSLKLWSFLQAMSAHT